LFAGIYARGDVADAVSDGDLLGNLEVDADGMRAGAGASPDLGAASELIDRALETHGR
jgi:hypothetical protein